MADDDSFGMEALRLGDDGVEDLEADEENALLEQALEMNRQLRAALAAQEAGVADSPPQQQRGAPRRGGPASPRAAAARRRAQQQQAQAPPRAVEGATLDTRTGGNIRRSQPRSGNYTFSHAEAENVSKGNMRLLNKMMAVETNRKNAGFSRNDRYEGTRHQAAAAINRRRGDDKISRENQKMAGRLLSVKSSGLGGARRKESMSHRRGPVSVRNKPRPRAAVLLQPEWNDRP